MLIDRYEFNKTKASTMFSFDAVISNACLRKSANEIDDVKQIKQRHLSIIIMTSNYLQK